MGEQPVRADPVVVEGVPDPDTRPGTAAIDRRAAVRRSEAERQAVRLLGEVGHGPAVRRPRQVERADGRAVAGSRSAWRPGRRPRGRRRRRSPSCRCRAGSRRSACHPETTPGTSRGCRRRVPAGSLGHPPPRGSGSHRRRGRPSLRTRRTARRAAGSGRGEGRTAAGDGASLAAGDASALLDAAATVDGSAPPDATGEALGEAVPPVRAGTPQIAAAMTAITTTPDREVRRQRAAGGRLAARRRAGRGAAVGSGRVRAAGWIGGRVHCDTIRNRWARGWCWPVDSGFRCRPRRRRLSIQPTEGHTR